MQLHKPLDDLVVADFLDTRLVEDHGPKHGSFLTELVHLLQSLPSTSATSLRTAPRPSWVSSSLPRRSLFSLLNLLFSLWSSVYVRPKGWFAVVTSMLLKPHALIFPIRSGEGGAERAEMVHTVKKARNPLSSWKSDKTWLETSATCWSSRPNRVWMPAMSWETWARNLSRADSWRW